MITSRIHGTPQQNHDTVWEDLLLYWDDNETKDVYSNLKMSMYVSVDAPHDTFPQLKGRAAEVRHLVPALAHVWHAAMDPARGDLDFAAQTQIYQGLLHSATMDDILDQYPEDDVLPREAADEFIAASWGYAQCQNSVASFYNGTLGLMVFDITIKTHYTLHCAMVARFLNPRKSWNYAGEDFMHKVKILMQSCVTGNTVTACIGKFSSKYAYALHLLLTEFELGVRN